LPDKNTNDGGETIMALIITIKVNTDTLRGYSAQRLDDKKTGWNNYLIKKHTIDQLSERIECIGTIRHKYEDGADILVYKVMKFVTGRK